MGRGEHDELLAEVMALSEGERLGLLREWKVWDAARERYGEMLGRLQERGLDGLEEADLVRLYVVQLRQCRRPTAARGLLGDLQKMREARWRKRYEEERESRAEYEKRANIAEAELAAERRKTTADLERERARVRAETRKEMAEVAKRERGELEAANEAVDRALGVET